MLLHVALCFLSFACGEIYALQRCVSEISSALEFSITSRRNMTGNWVAEVTMRHEAGQKDAGPWELDIDHTISKCGNRDTITITTTATAPSFVQRKPPAAGYDLVPGFGYYKLHTAVKSWPDARAACEKEGANLLIINSQEEANALGPFWDKNPKILDGPYNDWAHAGFLDLNKKGEYLTIFNQTLVAAGYVKWFGNDPDGGSQNCGIVIRRDNLLADIGCDAKQPFFCEFEL